MSAPLHHRRREAKPRHIRIPVPLLLSRHHSALDVAVYGLLDLLGRAAREETEAIPVEATRKWLAWRLGATESGIAKALHRLGTAHSGDATTPPAPVYVQSQQRGRRKSALRTTLAGVPWVEVPEWSLGAPDAPMPTKHRTWRFYALTLHLRHHHYGTVAHPRTQLATLAGVRDDTVPGLVRAARAAGLLLAAGRAGKASVLAPVTEQLPPAELDRAEAQLVAAYATPAPHPSAGTTPHPCEGTAPHPPTGTAPHPSAGTAYIGDPPYGDPKNEDPAPEGAPLAGRPRPVDPDGGVFVAPAAASRYLAWMVSNRLVSRGRLAAMSAAGASPVQVLAHLADDAWQKHRGPGALRPEEVQLAVAWARHLGVAA